MYCLLRLSAYDRILKYSFIIYIYCVLLSCFRPNVNLREKQASCSPQTPNQKGLSDIEVRGQGQNRFIMVRDTSYYAK